MTSSINQLHMLAAAMGALALVGAAIAAGMWHGVDQQARQEAERQKELREFHADLLNGVESLAEKSGMLTSADLCPVRFRLRVGTAGGNVPSHTYTALARLIKPELQSFRTHRNGRIEYGLMAPGHYQIEFKGVESYMLQHDFDVLPGVPIDRLVLCPPPTPLGLSMPVEINWPDSAAMEDVIAVCEIERNVASLGEWTWQPTEEERLRVIAGVNTHTVSDHDSSTDSTCQTVACRSVTPSCQWTGGALDVIWQVTAPDELVALTVQHATNPRHGQ